MQRFPNICAADISSVAFFFPNHFHLKPVHGPQPLQRLRIPSALKAEPKILSNRHKSRTKLSCQHISYKCLRSHMRQLWHKGTLQQMLNACTFEKKTAFFIGHDILPGQSGQHPGRIFLKCEDQRCQPLPFS